jgi:superfamily II DNA/RNA helicase
MTTQTSMSSFQELNLNPAILAALEKLNFSTPTPIQAMSVPSLLAGKDVQAEASTGTGKTLSFLLPIFQAALEDRSFRALILVPTRELVTQVGDVIETFRKVGLRAEWVGLSGGTSILPQLRRLRRPVQIYVGTPGRVYDHLSRGSLQIDTLRAFVLDEADRMLDMGFAPQIKKIQSFFPEEKPQTMFFSATYPDAVKKLVASLLQDPVFVKAVSKDIQKPDIDQDAFFMDQKDKFNALVKQLKEREGSVLVFSQTQRSTEKLAHRLIGEGMDVGRIHGGLNQGQRNRTLKDFRNGATRVLIATDVAARGLDVDHVNHVINYDIPQQAEDYIHRIGRTGRAGRKGNAISFVTHDDRQVWREIRTIVRKQLEVDLPEFFPQKRSRDSKKSESSSRPSYFKSH